MENIKPPQKDLTNKVHEYLNECAKNMTGGLFNPLIDFVLPSFHQKRFDKWCENIYFAIKELQENSLSGIDLIADEEFVSLLKESVSIAAKTHQQEKHQLLKNALLNHFSSNLSFDSKIMFIQFIESLTVPHIVMLKLVDKHSYEIKNFSQFVKIEEIIKNDPVSNTIPDNLYKMIIKDLERLNLIEVGAISYDMKVSQTPILSVGGGSKLPHIIVTDFGNDFLKYVEDY